MPPASVFRHPASQSGTEAFRYRPRVHLSGTGMSGIIRQNCTKVCVLKVAQLGSSVAHMVLRSSVENTIAQKGKAQLSRVQRSSVGLSVAQYGSALLCRVQRNSVRVT